MINKIQELNKKLKEFSVWEKQFIASVKTKWKPPEGFFLQSASKIARGLKDSHKSLSSAMSSLQFFRNRAGKNLSLERDKELEKVEGLLRKLYKESLIMNKIQQLITIIEGTDPISEESTTLRDVLLKYSGDIIISANDIIISANDIEDKGINIERGISASDNKYDLNRKVFIEGDGSIIFISELTGLRIRDYQSEDPPDQAIAVSSN